MSSDHGLIGRAVLLVQLVHLIAIYRGRHRRARAVMLQRKRDGTPTVAGRRGGERDVQPLPNLGHVPFGCHGHLPDGGRHTGSSASASAGAHCGSTGAGPGCTRKGTGGQEGVAARFRLRLIEGEGMVGKSPAGAGTSCPEGRGDAVRTVGGGRGKANGHGGVRGWHLMMTIAPHRRSRASAGRRGWLLLMLLLLGMMIITVAVAVAVAMTAAVVMIVAVVPGRRGGHHLRRRAGRRRKAPTRGGAGCCRRRNASRRTDEARFQQFHPPFQGGAAAVGGLSSASSGWGHGRRRPPGPTLLGAHCCAV